MGIFDILAETKITEWLRQPKPKTVKKETSREPQKTYEGYLLDQIKDLIRQAADETGDTRGATLQKADALQVQLLVSLEPGGHFMMAKETEKIILRHKMKYLN